MDANTLSFWTNVAAIFLMVEALILTAVFGVALWFARVYLRKGRLALAMPFLKVQVYTLRIQQITMKTTDAVAGVPIGIHSALARVGTTAQILVRGRKGSPS